MYVLEFEQAVDKVNDVFLTLKIYFWLKKVLRLLNDQELILAWKRLGL